MARRLYLLGFLGLAKVESRIWGGTSSPALSFLAVLFANFSLPKRRSTARPLRAQGEQRGYQFGDLFINKLTGKDKYQFGDLSRHLTGQLSEAVGNFTGGKDSYEFGDITKAADAKAKAEVCKITGKDVYELGDISKFLDGQAKSKVADLLGKEQYEFGDISREIARRAKEAEIDEEDLKLLLRAVLALGAGLTPVAHLLPIQVLLNLYGSSLELELSQRLLSRLTASMAKELDRRAKEAMLGKGNEDYVLGDLTRAQMQRSIKELTGKEEYEFGDISKSLLSRVKKSRS
ncbi:unnamed protein product [Effrenium voratum]|nr:unnamed protein product [Effrenium voratum]